MEKSYRITANGVLTYERTLRLGSANFFIDDYTNAEGERKRGPMALLVMWRSSGLNLPQQKRVHPGERVTFEDYDITVSAIDGRGRFVEVEIDRHGAGTPREVA